MNRHALLVCLLALLAPACGAPFSDAAAGDGDGAALGVELEAAAPGADAGELEAPPREPLDAAGAGEALARGADAALEAAATRPPDAHEETVAPAAPDAGEGPDAGELADVGTPPPGDSGPPACVVPPSCMCEANAHPCCTASIACTCCLL